MVLEVSSLPLFCCFLVDRPVVKWRLVGLLTLVVIAAAVGLIAGCTVRNRL